MQVAPQLSAETGFRYAHAQIFFYLLCAYQEDSMKKWQCIVCGLIYDEAEGWPDDGIPAGTRWEDVPADWQCPDCGVGKEDFEMIAIG